MDFGFTSVAAITVVCYLVAMGIKAANAIDEWIPFVCGALGGFLGIPAMLVIPTFPAQDWLTAVAIGIVSGFAATGVNQMVKQIGKGE